MRITRLRHSKKVLSSIGLVTVAALSVPLFNWIPVHAANTVVGNNTLVSVDSTGSGSGNGHSNLRAVSEDGNVILFTSEATNLPASNGPGTATSYVRNVSAGTTVRLDASASGVLGNGASDSYVISRTGRYATFSSIATNLIDGTTVNPNYKFQSYIKDLKTGEVELLSNPNDAAPAGAPSINPFYVSDDGRFVFFSTKYTGSYIAGLRSGYMDVIMLDRVKGSWTLVNAPATGSLQNVNTSNGVTSVSCDGSFFVFQSTATNLTTSYSGSGTHLFLADLRNGLTITDITQGLTADSSAPAISCNGRYVTFWTKDRTFVTPTPSGMTADPHAVRYDRLSGDRQYIDSDSSNNFAPSPGSFDRGYINVSDKGDTVITYMKWNSLLHVYNAYVYLKHLSDGSGTLEVFQKNPSSGTTYDYDELRDNTKLSADGKFITYRTLKSYNIGLPTGGSYEQIVRTETGL